MPAWTNYVCTCGYRDRSNPWDTKDESAEQRWKQHKKQCTDSLNPLD